METKTLLTNQTEELTQNNDIIQPIDKTKFQQSIADVSPSQIRKMIHDTSIIIIYSSAAVGSSTALLFIPNLETITLFIFLVAYLYGYRVGFAMMLTTAILFEFFATIAYGFAGYLFFFKLVSYSITTIIGAFIGKAKQEQYEYTEEKEYNTRIDEAKNKKNTITRTKYTSLDILFFSVIGFFLTIIYDLITLFANLIVIPSIPYLLVSFVIGLPWFLWHEVTNALLFMLIPKLVRIIHITETNYVPD